MQNKRVSLRAVEPSDIDFIYRLENDADNRSSSEQPEHVSRYVIEQYVLSIGDDLFSSGQMRMIIEVQQGTENRPIGCIELFDADAFHRRAGIGIYIIPDEQKKGYASEALDLMIKYCFGTLGLHQLFCNIGEQNAASLRLFTKYGFQVIGLKKDWRYFNSAWHNEYMLQLINSNVR